MQEAPRPSVVTSVPLCGTTMRTGVSVTANAVIGSPSGVPPSPSRSHWVEHGVQGGSRQSGVSSVPLCSHRVEHRTGASTTTLDILVAPSGRSPSPSRSHWVEHESQEASRQSDVSSVPLCSHRVEHGTVASTMVDAGIVSPSVGRPPPPSKENDQGWSFGSHVGATSADGSSIWPGAQPVARQRRRCFDSGGSGWNRDMQSRLRSLPTAEAPAPTYCQVLDGTLSAQWFGASTREVWLAAGRGKDGLPPRLIVPANHTPWLHDDVLPLPELSVIRKIEAECRVRPPNEFGPLGTRWLKDVHAWGETMKQKYQGARTAVAGSWRLNIQHWEKRLSRLPKARRERVLKLIRHGVSHPFKHGRAPSKPIRSLNNHPRLRERPVEVWQTLLEQLDEGAVDPHDCGGAIPVGAPAGAVPQGCTDEAVLPRGLYPIRWVTKTGSDRVRIVINMIPFNKWLKEESGAVDLATLSKISSLWQQGDDQITLDQHNAYYHLEYTEDAREWVGFMVDDSELPASAIRELTRRCPSARWGASKWVFTYRGLAMGCKPSAAQYCECSDALMDTWRDCTVGEAVGLHPEQPRCSQYIDDSIYLVQGFAHAMELGLRVVLEHIICGYHINIAKSKLLPHMKRQFLGCWCDSSDLSFSLTPKRCSKLRCRLGDLRRAVSVASRARGAHARRVGMRDVARVVGSIWSIQVVCHKAVSIMARAMISVLAAELRHECLRKERNRHRLKRLLRAAWRRTTLWSKEADDELAFWETIQFENLKAPMQFDALAEDAKAAIVRPAVIGLHKSVRVFCSDSSNRATGAAEFKPDEEGEWHAVDTMFVALSAQAIRDSSTYAELEGVLKTDLTLLPAKCKHVFMVCDNEAVTIILQKGSRIPALQRMAAAIFRKCLRVGRVLHPIWQRRTTKIVKIADLGSRVVDHYNFYLPMHLFWRANAVAHSLWGRGFQFDRFASFDNVMPMECRRKLPYNSFYTQPFSSGRCALAQGWAGWVNWAHPPHHLIHRVIGLIRRQRAVAAVVLPMGARAIWSHAARRGAEGVSHVLTFNPRSRRNRLIGKVSPTTWRGLFAIVFFDFRMVRSPFVRSPSAEHLVVDGNNDKRRDHDHLLFCMAPGLFPGRGAHCPNRFARCDIVLR